jgi:hypothetical protein
LCSDLEQVWERECGRAGKKAKTTPDAGGKSVSEKSQATRTSKNPFEKSSIKQTEYFVRVVTKDKRTGKNGPLFLIGWRDFPLVFKYFVISFFCLP